MRPLIWERTRIYKIMTDQACIGIDIGGTNLRAGVVVGRQIAHLHHEPIGAWRDPSALAAHLARVIPLLPGADREISHIGIGLPGIVDVVSQKILRSPHYPEWIDVPFGKIFYDALRLPVHLDNDANMILRGEHLFGAARGLRHAVMATLGTGIGGALLIDGKIFHGNTGFAGEIGHMVIDRDGPACDCGGRGCWELYASRQAFTQPPHEVTDPRQWAQFGKNLGIGIASLVNVLGMEDVIIGGGLSQAWDRFEGAMRAEILRRTYPETAARIRVHRAQLGDIAGILGAAVFSEGHHG